VHDRRARPDRARRFVPGRELAAGDIRWRFGPCILRDLTTQEIDTGTRAVLGTQPVRVAARRAVVSVRLNRRGRRIFSTRRRVRARAIVTGATIAPIERTLTLRGTQAPAAAFRPRGTLISHRGRMWGRITCEHGRLRCVGRLVLRRPDGRRIGHRRISLPAGGRALVSVPLHPAADHHPRRHGRLRVRATVTTRLPAGTPATRTTGLLLRALVHRQPAFTG
jgi:hypothetical protein